MAHELYEELEILDELTDDDDSLLDDSLLDDSLLDELELDEKEEEDSKRISKF